jgi:hypothetical protein
MNEKELDELLNAWETPPVPASLRAGVQAGIATKSKKPQRSWFSGWRLLAAGAAAAVVVVMLANTSAFPEKISPPPFVVESQITVPGAPDCNNCWKYVLYPGYPGPSRTLMRSFNQAGSEVVLSWSTPDHTFEGAALATKLAVSNAIGSFHRFFGLSADEKAERELRAVISPRVGEFMDIGERAFLVSSGCRPSGRHGEVIGQEVVLNYPTTVVRVDFWHSRMILWMAPELSCFALRATVEAQQPDGSWTLMSDKKALKVTVNPQ